MDSNFDYNSLLLFSYICIYICSLPNRGLLLCSDMFAINAIIEFSILYKASINYCAINTQIVIILSKIYVRSVIILQFSQDFLLTFVLSKVQTKKQKQRNKKIINWKQCCWNNQLSNEYWISWIAYIIMREHLKYCTQ